MKKAIMILAIVLTSISMFGQDISGKWYGNLRLYNE